jgi:hypothetical protein
MTGTLISRLSDKSNLFFNQEQIFSGCFTTEIILLPPFTGRGASSYFLCDE